MPSTQQFNAVCAVNDKRNAQILCIIYDHHDWDIQQPLFRKKTYFDCELWIIDFNN